MRLSALAASIGVMTVCAGSAAAQTSFGAGSGLGWTDSASPITARLNSQASFVPATDRAYGPAGPARTEAQTFASADDALSPWVATSRDVWTSSDTHSDRVRVRSAGPLRRLDGAPVPTGPRDSLGVQAEDYDISFVRGWPTVVGYTPSGLEVSVTPHAGVGVGSRGGSAEAGATVRIGRDLDKLVPEGQDAFGERGRWYIYAAGSGRAVGYNFARNRDGDYARSGYSHDSGVFLGDAQLGVAWRRGDMQSSFGVIYREIEPEGLRVGSRSGIDTDVSEGLIAFQLSIKPD
jgi:hypothetical protein